MSGKEKHEASLSTDTKTRFIYPATPTLSLVVGVVTSCNSDHWVLPLSAFTPEILSNSEGLVLTWFLTYTLFAALDLLIMV